MPHFSNKQFEGVLYTFGHLSSFEHRVPLSASQAQSVKLHVSFSSHCFTEAFDEAVHLDHHRYTHAGETRAFDLTRYRCSLN